MRGIIQRPGYDSACTMCGGGGIVLIPDTQDEGPVACYTLADEPGCPRCDSRREREERRIDRKAGRAFRIVQDRDLYSDGARRRGER